MLCSFVDVDAAERGLQERDRKSHGEFSAYMDRCINQCYQPRRGINDPRLGGADGAVTQAQAQAAAMMVARGSPPRLRKGEKPKYIGQPLDPLVPER